MRVEFEFYATMRDAVGERRLVRDVPADATVGEALSAIAAEYERVEHLAFDSDGRLRPHVNVARNGENVRALDGADTALADGDTLTVAPAVAGG